MNPTIQAPAHTDPSERRSSGPQISSQNITSIHFDTQPFKKRTQSIIKLKPQKIVLKTKQQENTTSEAEIDLKNTSMQSGITCSPMLQKNISTAVDCLLMKESSSASTFPISQTLESPYLLTPNLLSPEGKTTMYKFDHSEDGDSVFIDPVIKISPTPPQRHTRQFSRGLVAEAQKIAEECAVDDDSDCELSFPRSQRIEESKENSEKFEQKNSDSDEISEAHSQPLEENQHANQNQNEVIELNGSNPDDQEAQAAPSDIPENENTPADQVNNEPTSNEPTAADYRNFGRPEMKVFIAKVAGFYFTAALCSLVLLFNAPVDVLYFAIVLVMAYHVFLDVRWKYRIIEELMIDTEDWYRTLDGILLSAATLFLYLRYAEALSFSALLCAPFGTSLGAYCSNTSISRKRKFKGAALRLTYLGQSLFIFLVYDRIVVCDWHYVFIIGWIYLTIVLIKQVMNIIALCKKIRRNTTSTMNNSRIIRKTRIIGFVWYLFYSGNALMAFIGLFGIAGILNDKDNRTPLTVVTIITAIFSSALCIATIAYRRYLIAFILSYGLVNSHLVNYYASLPKDPVREVKFEVESKESFFVMVSSTYFQPLHKSFLNKEKVALIKIKDVLGVMKSKRPSSVGGVYKNQRIELKTLKQEKEDLDKIISKVELRQTDKKPLEKRHPGLSHNASAIFEKKVNENTFGNDQISLEIRPTISSQNHREIKKFYDNEVPQQQKDDEERQCYLCCINSADAIIIGCGHGGFCHDCAITSVKKKEQCMECRAKVEGIYKIDPNPRLTNIVKGLQLTKVIVKEA